MPSFETGRRYYGPNNSSLIIMAIDGDVVTAMKPMSGERITLSVSDVESWKKESDRRIYYPADPKDRRTKMATFPDPNDNSKTLVQYVDANCTPFIVSEEDWMIWRNALPAI